MEVYQQIQQQGVYHCDINRSVLDFCREQFDWLADEMRVRIGNSPEGATHPIWAWYMWEGIRKKPDLRRARWGNGWKGDQFACMEIDIPEDRLVLTDFDSWSIILLNGLISDTEEEDIRQEQEYESLSENEKKEYRDQNWRRVFDLSFVDNGWMHRGDSIQATFWELRKEDIREVRFFTSAIPRRD